jgi:predicted ABC-type ATPase
MDKNFYILAGPNGAGKTTLSESILREIFHCRNFINGDEIAKGLSPLETDKFNVQAGRIMLKQIEYYANLGESFSVETTLSSRLYLKKINNLRELGYNIVLFFIYLPNVVMAIERVKIRVLKGGHNIPVKIIRRRYKRGLLNLFGEYADAVDELYVYSNTANLSKIFSKTANGKIEVSDKDLYNKIKGK